MIHKRANNVKETGAFTVEDYTRYKGVGHKSSVIINILENKCPSGK
jgi:hypothetical protein